MGATENLAASSSAKKCPARFPGRFVTLGRFFGESKGFSLRGLCSRPEAPSGLDPPPPALLEAPPLSGREG